MLDALHADAQRLSHSLPTNQWQKRRGAKNLYLLSSWHESNFYFDSKMQQITGGFRLLLSIDVIKDEYNYTK